MIDPTTSLIQMTKISNGIIVTKKYSNCGYIHNPNCFGTATAADLVIADGTKLIGSAQLRRNTTILQHGSIRIAPDPGLFHQIFGQGAALPTLSRWTQNAHFSSPASHNTIVKTIMDALAIAACAWFEMDYQVQPLSPREWNSVVAQSHKWHKPQQGN